MSSDSDIEYESADEESSESSEAAAKLVQTSKSTSKSENASEPETKLFSKELPHTSEIKNKNVPNRDLNVEKNALESISAPENSDKLGIVSAETIPEIKPGEIEPAKIEPGSIDPDTKNPIEVKSQKDSDGQSVTATKDGSGAFDSQVETSVKPEKQRVPLRLEKKIQQRSRSSEESSAEKPVCEESQKKSEVKSSSWGFGSWGSSLLSTAAYSVSTLTNQVSQGIETVMETVESTLGVPPPEELAASVSKASDSTDPSVEKASDTKANEENVSEPRSSLLPDVSAWTKVLENTGSKVLMGGLDTLELIGKKTIDLITEGDPGLRQKRSLFGDGVNLSQILREAKAEADESKLDASSTGIGAVHFTQFFDDYQGLVHLEALEMLSKQSEVKIHRNLMRISKDTEIRKQIEEIKSICEDLPSLDDSSDGEHFEEFDAVCKKHILELNLAFNAQNLIKARNKIADDLKNYETGTISSSPEEIYESAICNLAKFTATSIETFHKLAELILVQTKLEPSGELFANNLTGLTNVMCIEINSFSSRYQHCLDSLVEQSEDGESHKKNVTTIVTNLYVEASNSIKYIQDAFLLLVPVLQASLLEL